MQIKIEVDVRPDELRRFLGLPDVAALPADVLGFVRDFAGAASEFDATQFVKTNLESLSKTSRFQKFAARVGLGDDEPQTGRSKAPSAQSKPKPKPKPTTDK